jgi:hypothetical protein
VTISPKKVLKSSVAIMRDNISGNIEKSLLVVEQVKDLQNIIDDAPDLDENVTYGEESISI